LQVNTSNIASFNILLKASTNPLIHFYSIQGKNHFSTLAPITKLIATKILLDDGRFSNIQFTREELEGGSRFQKATQDIEDFIKQAEQAVIFLPY
jgi:hypothetical protein